MGRRWLSLLAALLVCSATGCATGTQGSGGGSSSGGVVTLSWGMWGSGTGEVAAWQQVADRVHAKHPDIVLKLETAPFNDYFTKLQTRLANRSEPCLIAMQTLRLGGYRSVLAPLDAQLKASGTDLGDFETSVLGALTGTGGEQLALPYDVGPVVMVYNKDRFRAAGLPEPRPGWTQQEFLTAARALTGGGRYGFATYPSDLWIMPWLLSESGVQPVGQDGRLRLDDPKLAEALGWYAGLITEQKVAPVLPGMDISFAANEFANGNAAMSLDGPWSLLSLRKDVKFELGVVPLPVGPAGSRTVAAGSGFGISKTCPYPEQAFRALRELTGPEVLAELGTTGRALPARKSVQHKWYDNAGMPEARAAVSYANEHADPLRTSENWEQFTQLMQQFGVLLMNGNASAKQVLHDIAEQLRG